MRLRILSDLHLEFSDYKVDQNIDEDLVVLAGDIKEGGAFEWAKKTFGQDKKILYVFGNHEYYNQGDIDTFESLAQTKASQHNIILDTEFENILKLTEEDTYIVSGTLWTDYKLFEKTFGWSQRAAMEAVKMALNDYYVIGTPENRPTPQYFNYIHKTSVETISRQSNQLYSKNPDAKLVVISHHAPSIKSSLPRYLDNIVTAGFASDLEDFIKNHPNIKLWIFGHVHNSNDFMIGQCRCVSNPKGYSRYIGDNKNTGKPIYRLENQQFDPNLIVEI